MRAFKALLAAAVIVGGVVTASPVSDACVAFLDAQSAVLSCAGGYQICNDGGSCCHYFTGAMNWKACRQGPANTGKACGSPTKKYYNVQLGNCIGTPSTSCVLLPWGTSGSPSTLYEDDYTLIACDEPDPL